MNKQKNLEKCFNGAPDRNSKKTQYKQQQQPQTLFPF